MYVGAPGIRERVPSRCHVLHLRVRMYVYACTYVRKPRRGIHCNFMRAYKISHFYCALLLRTSISHFHFTLPASTSTLMNLARLFCTCALGVVRSHVHCELTERVVCLRAFDFYQLRAPPWLLPWTKTSLTLEV